MSLPDGLARPAVEPWAYFLTFACYGERLHGDDRGSVDPEHNGWRTPYIETNPSLRRVERDRMSARRVRLCAADRDVVLGSIRSVCEHQSWTLHAAHVRRTHVHIIVTAASKPEAVMNTFKAYASRALGQTRRWSRHGSTGYIWNPHELQSAIDYVVHGQGNTMSCYQNPTP